METIDCEQAILSAVLHDRVVLGLIAPELIEDRFFDFRNRIIYSSMLDHFNQTSSPPDVLTLQKSMDSEDLNKIGGVSYLREIEGALRRLNIHSTKGVIEWVRIIDDAGRLRHLKTLVDETSHKIDGDKIKDVDLFCANLVDNIYSTQKGSKEGFSHISTFIDEFMFDVGEQLEGRVVSRIPVGWPSWDNRLGGGLPVGLTLISARPGMGKTQTALLIARNIAEEAVKQEIPGVVAIISLEMTGKQVISRLVCAGARIDSRVLDAGLYVGDEEVRERIDKEATRIKSLPIHVDQSDYLTAEMIDYRASVLHSMYGGLLLLVIDFAELISSEKEEIEEIRTSKIYLKAKALSKKLRIPVILICQQNRSIEFTQTKLPSVSAIRWSGMAEAIADLIVLVYNPGQYEQTGVTVQTPRSMPADSNRIYFIIGKQREGQVGHFGMGWERIYTRIWDQAEGVVVGREEQF